MGAGRGEDGADGEEPARVVLGSRNPGRARRYAAATPAISRISAASLKSARCTSPASEPLRNNTLIYAQVGHALLIATSQSMMDRALDSYARGTGGLAEDAAYLQMSRQMPAGAQSLLMIDLPRIMQAFRPGLTNFMAGNHAGSTAEDIVRLFGQRSGIIGSLQYDGKALKGYFFMPLDYDRLIHIIGAAQRGSARPGFTSAFFPTSGRGSVVQ